MALAKATVTIVETFMVFGYQMGQQAVVPEMIVTGILTKLPMEEDRGNQIEQMLIEVMS